MSTPKILIDLDGGLVHGVFIMDGDGFCAEIPATIRDYDLDGVDEDQYEIKRDVKGREYIEYEA